MAREDRAQELSEEELDGVILRYTRQNYTHLLVNSLLLLLLLLAAVGGLLMVKQQNLLADQLLAIKPENRVERLEKLIQKSRKSVEKQYAQYTDRMNDDSIYAVNRRFAVIYESSRAGEVALSKLIAEWADASYEIASHTKGSGEWYFYFEKALKNQLLKQQNRELKLNDYLKRHSAELPTAPEHTEETPASSGSS